MIDVPDVHPYCRTHKRACDACGWMQPVLVPDGRGGCAPGLDAGVTMEREPDRVEVEHGLLVLRVRYAGSCLRCGEEHVHERTELLGPAP